MSAPSADIQTSDVRASDARKPTRKVSVRALVVLVIVALVVYGFDQLAKFLVVKNMVEGSQVEVLGQLLQFHFVKNSGAAFSLASGSTWIFSIAAAAVTVFILVFARRIRALSWAVLFGMLLGGTVGNLTDRLFREPSFGLGHVVDFIQVYGFPAIFNVADSFIVASMGLFIILTLRGTNLDGRRVMHMVPVARGDEVEPSEDGTQGRG
ncbi:signal peptidase II [Parafrigoribacterium humi]|uniref:signal peptidase II n=1 Tax=Parafrigoribacterium humi TaxID=3144664 RepID=UPI0032ECB507